MHKLLSELLYVAASCAIWWRTSECRFMGLRASHSRCCCAASMKLSLQLQLTTQNSALSTTMEPSRPRPFSGKVLLVQANKLLSHQQRNSREKIQMWSETEPLFCVISKKKKKSNYWLRQWKGFEGDKNVQPQSQKTSFLWPFYGELVGPKLARSS